MGVSSTRGRSTVLSRSLQNTNKVECGCFVLIVNALKSFMISIGSAFVVGTKESPLLSRSICVFVSWTLDRLNIVLDAHWKQFGLMQSSGKCVVVCFLSLSFFDGLLWCAIS